MRIPFGINPRSNISFKSDKIRECGISTVIVIRNITQPIGVVIDTIGRQYYAQFFRSVFKNDAKFLKD